MSLEDGRSKQPEQRERKNPHIFRSATWNIKLGEELKQVIYQVQTAPDFAALDLFALQEVSEHNGVEDAQVVAETLQSRNGGDYTYMQFGMNRLHDVSQSNAIIWNAERINHGLTDIVQLPTIANGSANKAEKLAYRWRREQLRNGISLEGEFEGTKIRAYSIHADIDGFVSHKRAQLEHILLDNARRNHTSDNPAHATFLLGDINTWRIPLLNRPK